MQLEGNTFNIIFVFFYVLLFFVLSFGEPVLVCSLGWPSPISASRVLGLLMCTNMHGNAFFSNIHK